MQNPPIRKIFRKRLSADFRRLIKAEAINQNATLLLSASGAVTKMKMAGKAA